MNEQLHKVTWPEYLHCHFTFLFIYPLAVLDLHSCVGFLWLQWAEAVLLLPSSGSSVLCLFLLQSTGSRVHRLHQLWLVGAVAAAPRLESTGSIVIVHRLSSSTTHGIFPDQESNPCLLHGQADSSPLSHQGNPTLSFSLQISTFEFSWYFPTPHCFLFEWVLSRVWLFATPGAYQAPKSMVFSRQEY